MSKQEMATHGFLQRLGAYSMSEVELDYALSYEPKIGELQARKI